MAIITIKGCQCNKCGHVWAIRKRTSQELPELCPHCHSAYWNKPRKNKRRQTSTPRPIQPIKQTTKPTRGRAGTFTTSAVAPQKTTAKKTKPMPKYKPTQKEIDAAGIGGAT